MSALDVVEAQTETGIPSAADSSEPAGTYRKRKLGFWFWASVVWLVLLLFGAVFADLLPLKDPDETFRGVARQGPGSEHWFGADNIGHDVFSRTIYGARRSLAIAGVATIVGTLLGTAVGLLSGFYRRAIDGTIQAVHQHPARHPGPRAAAHADLVPRPAGRVARRASRRSGSRSSLSILVIPGIARIRRAQTMVWGDRDFVMASRTLGARNKRIILREILPNVVPTLVSFAFTLVAGLIIVEAALAFFGIGDVSGVSWGLMIQNGRSQLERTPHMVLFPAMFMFLTILSLNFVGDALRTRFDVREGRHLMAGSGTAHLRDGHRRRCSRSSTWWSSSRARAARSTRSATSASTSSTARRSASSASRGVASRRPARRSCACRRRRRATSCSTASTCRRSTRTRCARCARACR